VCVGKVTARVCGARCGPGVWVLQASLLTGLGCDEKLVPCYFASLKQPSKGHACRVSSANGIVTMNTATHSSTTSGKARTV
jgi:hypothetical protein